FTRYPFSSSEATAKAPLDEVVMDVVGPLKLGAAGAEYFLAMMDVYTRMTWVYVLSKKCDAAETVKTDWLPMVERQQDRLVKSIRTDRGGEFLSKEFSLWLKKNGIRHSLTMSYSPAMNSIAERANRTITETTRGLLIEVGLPDYFWPDAVRSTCVAKSRALTHVGADKWVPYVDWIGRKPKVDMLRVFACMCMALVLMHLRHNKLGAKAMWAVHFGMAQNSKGWLLWDPFTKKFLVRRDCKFMENLMYKDWKAENEAKIGTGFGEGILQSFTLPDSPQQNGIAERRIGLVMEVARTSMIHAAAPHFLWMFAVHYAAHQLNLWPSVSLSETSPTLHWTGVVGDATSRLTSRFPFTISSPTALPLPHSDRSSLLQVDPLPGTAPVEVADGSGAAGGAASRGAKPGGAAFEGSGSGGAEPGGAEPAGVEPGGAEPEGVEPGPGGTGTGGARAVGARAVDLRAGGARGTMRPRTYFVPLPHQVLGVPSSSGLIPLLLCPPPDQSQPPLQPASPLPAHSPYNATALVAEFGSASPQSVEGESALGTDVLEDRQEDFECLAATVPCLASMLLAPEGDPDALDPALLRTGDYGSLLLSVAGSHGCRDGILEVHRHLC
ncbi:unnamed protein product, partial [Closterium sp. NIES-54]